MGELSEPLKRKNVREKIKADYPSVPLDKIDVEAYLTDERFSEIWGSIEEKVEMLADNDFSDMSWADVKNEIEKYEYLRSRRFD